MAMALSLLQALAPAFSHLSLSSSASSAISLWRPGCGPFSGRRVGLKSGKAVCQGGDYGGQVRASAYGTSLTSKATEERNLAAKAAADAPESETEIVAEATTPAIASLDLKSESELLKKKAKRLELRRKRLVRKRKLRKKGQWPPSKMAKTKNV